MTDSNKKIARRDLLVAVVTGAAVAPLISSLVASQAFAADVKKAAAKAAAGAMPAAPAVPAATDVKMAKVEGPDANPVAKALGYIEKSKVPGKTCGNCQLYTKDAAKKDGKEIGKCTMITGAFVFGEGYCNSWAKKA